MTDIIDRLDSGKQKFAGPLRVLLDEAKDEIALLRDERSELEAYCAVKDLEIKRLREALQKIANRNEGWLNRDRKVECALAALAETGDADD